MQTILYARVSTLDQTIEHQKEQAENEGFKIDRTIEDAGVSGVQTAFADRPGGKRLLDILRKGDTLVVRWVDRLGRNYADVTKTIRELMERGVVVKTIIHKMAFDGATKNPMEQAVRDALIAFMAATAQAQAEATKEAQRAGIAHAKAHGKDGSKAYRGAKPSFTRAQAETVFDMAGKGHGASDIAKATGLSRFTVIRIRDNPAKTEAILTAWGDGRTLLPPPN